MKLRTEDNGSKNDNWETPEYIYIWLNKNIFNNKVFFDPCPLNANFDGLTMEWVDRNYINPPYTRKGKEAFITKAYQESLKGKLCVLLIPASTETKIFHNIIVPNAQVYLIKERIKFKGFNSKNEYVTNKSGQSGSMFVIFGNGEPFIKALELI